MSHSIFPQDYDLFNVIKIIKIGFYKVPKPKVSRSYNIHSHSFAELHFSLKGTCVYQFADGSRVTVKESSWVLIPKNHPHKIIKRSDDYTKFSCVFSLELDETKRITDDSINKYLVEIIEKSTVSRGSSSLLASDLIEQIFTNFSMNYPLTTAMQNHLALVIILDVLSYILSKKLPQYKSSKNDPRLARAVQFIKDNVYHKISSDDVAQKVYLSTRQLNRIFEEAMSLSIAEFIFETKMEEAKSLLISTSIPIREISEKLGFSDPSYFNRFFKKREWITPNQYREKQKLENNLMNKTKK